MKILKEKKKRSEPINDINVPIREILLSGMTTTYSGYTYTPLTTKVEKNKNEKIKFLNE